MSFSTWTPPAVASEARRWRKAVWRVVEAQHVAASMKLVDSREEQDILEALLEDSKPALPAAARKLDYLLATPFRYHPLRVGSRFRAPGDPGVFYGAQSVRTACAELGYWRWRFLMDAAGLKRIDPVAHTAFSADVATRVVDLRKAPFDADSAYWDHPADYAATQRFAAVAREARLGGIVYRSVRDPRPAWCVALLTPDAFVAPVPRADRQTWWLAVTRSAVHWRREEESVTFAAGGWDS